MLLFVVDSDQTVVTCERDIKGREYRLLDLPINSKAGIAKAIETLLWGPAARTLEVGSKGPEVFGLGLTPLGKMEFVAQRQRNVETAAASTRKAQEIGIELSKKYYREASEDLLDKARRGIRFNNAMENLASMLFDMAARRANFGHLEDYQS